MALVFKTKEDSTERVELVGVGVLGANGKGGRPIADAAQSMTELQEVDDRGRLVLDDDGQPVPLTGSKLQAAAKKFAEAHNLEIVNLSDEEIATLPQELGAPGDRPPAVEVSKESYEAIFANLVHENYVGEEEREHEEEKATKAAKADKAEDTKEEGK